MEKHWRAARRASSSLRDRDVRARGAASGGRHGHCVCGRGEAGSAGMRLGFKKKRARWGAKRKLGVGRRRRKGG